MKIAMKGTGYVGLVSGACFADFGHDVVCLDKFQERIDNLNQGIIPIYEPGLDRLVEKNVREGRLTFSLDDNAVIADCDAVFIAVGTPSRRGDGHADLSYVQAAAQEIADAMRGHTVIVNKSTVPVGSAQMVREVVEKRLAETGRTDDVTFDVVSNPEFLREGSAIEDFCRPDRIVVGVASDRAQQIMTDIYRPIARGGRPVLFVDCPTAELIKYAANAFLATKISFINEMADLSEKVGANVQDVARGIGLDGRIGQKFLHAGPGYGGSCFPKDTLALARTAEEVGAPSRIVEAVIEANDRRKRLMAGRILDALGDKPNGKTVAILGVTFKPETDDMRESPALQIIPRLQDHGITIRAYDPEGMGEAEPLLPNVTWCKDAYDAMEGADAVAILTEWNQFRALDFDRVKSLLSSPTLVDLRNIYDPVETAEAGFHYSSIGRP